MKCPHHKTCKHYDKSAPVCERDWGYWGNKVERCDAWKEGKK